MKLRNRTDLLDSERRLILKRALDYDKTRNPANKPVALTKEFNLESPNIIHGLLRSKLAAEINNGIPPRIPTSHKTVVPARNHKTASRIRHIEDYVFESDPEYIEYRFMRRLIRMAATTGAPSAANILAETLRTGFTLRQIEFAIKYEIESENSLSNTKQLARAKGEPK